jgi:hypothetical protein
MQEKRPPDYITQAGSRFWFKELRYWSNTTGYKAIYVDKNGLLRMYEGKKGVFKKDIQELFRKWAVKESEELLVGGSTEETSS